MRMSSRMLGATLFAVAAAAMATPVFAQQDPPAAGQAPPEANGPGAPTQDAPPPGPPPGAAPQATPGGPARSAIVTANVNLRGGPGTDAEVITTIPAGSRVRVTDCSGEWCMVTWNGRSGFAIARNLDIGGARHARSYRAPPGYAGGPPPGYPDRPPAVYEAGPPVIYGAPAYYPPPVVVYGPGYYYGPRYYGWRRRW
jgi:Bacterial SH3 domain